VLFEGDVRHEMRMCWGRTLAPVSMSSSPAPLTGPYFDVFVFIVTTVSQ